MVLEVSQMAGSVTMAIVDVEGLAHEACSRLANGWKFDSNILVIDQNPLGDEGILGIGNPSEALGELDPEAVGIGFSESVL
jgi:hypothetical protein